MRLTEEMYTTTKQFLLDFAKLNVVVKNFKIKKPYYGFLPSDKGPVKFKPNDTISFYYDDGVIVKFFHNKEEYIPNWSQIKLEEVIGSKMLNTNTKLNLK